MTEFERRIEKVKLQLAAIEHPFEVFALLEGFNSMVFKTEQYEDGRWTFE